MGKRDRERKQRILAGEEMSHKLQQQLNSLDQTIEEYGPKLVAEVVLDLIKSGRWIMAEK